VELNKKFFISFFLILLTFIFDRISKIYIIKKFVESNIQDIYINHYLNLVLIWNKGIAFGLLQNDGNLYHLISLAIFIIIIYVNFIIYSSKKTYEVVCFSLISGGAIGNLFDRIYYNAVPDFIDIHFKNFHWFTFNVSDIFISLGILILIFSEFFNSKSNLKKNE